MISLSACNHCLVKWGIQARYYICLGTSTDLSVIDVRRCMVVLSSFAAACPPIVLVVAADVGLIPGQPATKFVPFAVFLFQKQALLRQAHPYPQPLLPWTVDSFHVRVLYLLHLPASIACCMAYASVQFSLEYVLYHARD